MNSLTGWLTRQSIGHCPQLGIVLTRLSYLIKAIMSWASLIIFIIN
jgi:hypothetical protein